MAEEKYAFVSDTFSTETPTLNDGKFGKNEDKSWHELNKYQKIASSMSVVLVIFLASSPLTFWYITRGQKVAEQTILISGLVLVIFAVSAVVISMIGNREEKREKEAKDEEQK